MTTRTIQKFYTGTPSIDGAGVKLNRIFGGMRDVTDLDPFLLLDYFDSSNPDDYLKGFSWHPHRGIETITYLVEGLLAHGDSLGNSGLIEPLGCQWMTAGRGIIHQEMPQVSPRMLGAQLWLNLPRAHKMTEPTYRDITAADLNIYFDELLEVKVIAGTFRGVTGPVKGTYVDPLYFDITLQPHGAFAMDVPADDTIFLLMLAGRAHFLDGQVLDAAQDKGGLLTKGAELRFASDAGMRCLMIAGQSLHEPVAWGGPIVMNTREELRQAFDELDRGTFIQE